MKALLAQYLEIFPGEKERLGALANFLLVTPPGPQLFHRKNFAGHITASGFVLSPDHKKLAVVRHQFLGRHLQPGGHVEEADENTLAAARREVREETGLANCLHLPFHSDPLLPMDIDTHEIPANPKKDEPPHFHHDFRFVFRAEKEFEPALHAPAGESTWTWRPVETAIDEPTFKLVWEKIKNLDKFGRWITK